MNKPDELISKYFHGIISPQELEQLSVWLKEDPAHAEAFAVEAYMVRSIRELLVSKRDQGSQNASNLLEEILRGAEANPAPIPEQPVHEAHQMDLTEQGRKPNRWSEPMGDKCPERNDPNARGGIP
jgi:hypothetical protein